MFAGVWGSVEMDQIQGRWAKDISARTNGAGAASTSNPSIPKWPCCYRKSHKKFIAMQVRKRQGKRKWDFTELNLMCHILLPLGKVCAYFIHSSKF